MCGIVGSYPAPDPEIVGKGLLALLHRGPDAHDLSETPYGSLGHARLAILDVAGGHQPMEDRDRWIVFNGEIYNYRALRRTLPGPLRTDSDTEVILGLYAARGPGCVAALDGMFAFALYDRGDLFLARDPLGIKPLYYAVHDDVLYFASEIKALAWFAERVEEFPPGHWWHSRHGFQRYYRVDALSPSTLGRSARPTDDDLSALQGVLRTAVRERLIADASVPIGVCLSGGVDSSIVAALAREAKEHLDTFVVGMAESEDLEASQLVAKHLGTCHHVLVYGLGDLLRVLPEVIYYLESFDAALVRSAIPNYFLARLASDNVKVILTGEGADELFAGYDYLAPIHDPAALHAELQTVTAGLHNTNLQRTDRMTMAHGIEARVPFLDTGVVETAFDLPPEWKLRTRDRAEKDLLRRAFEDLLPGPVVHRPKLKFSHGAGSAGILATYANDTISDSDFWAERRPADGVVLASKEELLYYRHFRRIFGDNLSPGCVGRTRSITSDELN